MAESLNSLMLLNLIQRFIRPGLPGPFYGLTPVLDWCGFKIAMSNSSSSSSSGIGFPGLLTVLFVGLKLTGHITWSWVWVFSPLWISLLIGLTVLAIIYLAAYWSVK